MKVGYMGVPGSYTEEAAVGYFKNEYELTGYPSFHDVVHRLETKEIRYGILAIENSSTGSVHQTLDLIREKNLYITGEAIQKVEHYLMAVKGSKLSMIKKVISHPQGLEQCGNYIRKNGWEIGTHVNTAAAAKEAAQKNDPYTAVIASKRAASIYGLEILDEKIQDNNHNYTRFVVLSGTKEITEGADKISLVFIVKNVPGSLYAAIQGFAENGVNLIKLESRPIWVEPWHYFFFMDLEGSLEDERIKRALSYLEIHCKSYRILGNYKKASFSMEVKNE